LKLRSAFTQSSRSEQSFAKDDLVLFYGIGWGECANYFWRQSPLLTTGLLVLHRLGGLTAFDQATGPRLPQWSDAICFIFSGHERESAFTGLGFSMALSLVKASDGR
jgi:hypothetical protein